MELEKIIQELLRNRDVFNTLLSGLEKELYLWKVKPEKWCLLEIICHLYDEEREDFRARTKHILDGAAGPFQSISPGDWVTERNYIKQDYQEMLHKFMSERDASVKWLKSLSKPDLSKSQSHPKFGEMTAKMFLSVWLAHDYLHIRQIIKVKYDFLEQSSGESLTYAGNW